MCKCALPLPPPQLPDDSTIYETIPGDVSSEAVVTTDQEGAEPGTPSVLQSIENTMRSVALYGVWAVFKVLRFTPELAITF